MDAAAALRRARLAAGLSLRELAQRAHTSHATIAAYESGRTVPRVDTLDRLLQAAGYWADITVTARPDGTADDRRAKAEELRLALDLAAQFPARHDAVLSFPPFPNRTHS